jgi:EAL domain-containing protein (putative c-di-GMP-specific phosphodiesterase class I)
MRQLQKILDKTRFDARNLSIELTESVAMQTNNGASEVLEKIKAMGAQITIDDFGAGHSSMFHLQKLPVDTLNIDRAFVMNIADRKKDGVTAKAIIALAHELGFRVRAEGVETAAQAEFLKRQQCDELQGHHISPPVDAQAISLLLAKQSVKAISTPTI